MKRRIVFLLFVLALTVSAILFIGSQGSLSEEERQKRAEYYTLLAESLHAVGYEQDFALKESKAMEENLRRLWLKESSFADARKNAELLVLVRNFDFIGEGLRKSSSYGSPSMNPYYLDWPRDGRYVSSSNQAVFSHEEVLWLMLLLPDADFPQTHLGLLDVLSERGADAFRYRSNYSIWPYFEKNYPGYLKQMDPAFWAERVSDEMAAAFRSADDAIQDRFMQAVDIKEMQGNYVRPRLILSLSEAEELMREFPPEGIWDGGYIRIVEPKIIGIGTKHPANTSAEVYESRSGDVLAAVSHPADARFAVYEEYTDKEYYSTYTRKGDIDDPIDVYLWKLHIRIVDLVTGKEILNETKRGNPPPEEISILSMLRSAYITGEGEYNYSDFDYDRYAAVMVAHIGELGEHDSEL